MAALRHTDTARTKRLAVPALLLAALALQLRAQTVIYDKEGSGVIDRGVVVPEGHLDEALAKTMAREFLDLYGPTHDVLNLVIAVNETELRASCYHRAEGIPSGGHDRAVQLRALDAEISRVGPPKHPIARFISISGNAVLTYRSADSISDEIMHGTDPTRLKTDRVEFQLLHLALSTGTAAVAEDVRYSLALYFRVKPAISVSATQVALRRLASTVRIRNLSVRVRRDPWFLEYDSYPLFPAFLAGLRPINIGQYDLSSYVTCDSSVRHGFQCSGKNFEP
jgi:hypothetical protein